MTEQEKGNLPPRARWCDECLRWEEPNHQSVIMPDAKDAEIATLHAQLADARAKLAAVEKLADEWARSNDRGWISNLADEFRAALAATGREESRV